MRKPYFKKSHKCWYVRDKGNDIRLDPDEETAFRKWQRVLDAARPVGDPDISVTTLASRFLSEQEVLLKTPRYKLVEHYVSQFAAKFNSTMAKNITPIEVLKWLTKKKQWKEWA